MRRWAPALLALSFFCGCSGTETGNPSFTGQISEAALASDPAVAALGPSQGGASVTKLWVAFGDLALTGCTPGAQPEVVAAAPNDDDLLSPAPAQFALRTSSFCSLSAPLVLATRPLPAGAPPELDGATLVVGGNRADGVPFLLVSAAAQHLTLAPQHGFSVNAGAQALLLGFDVSTLLTSVDLASGVPAADGTLHITSADNAALLHTASQNLPHAVGLYYDANHNGRFDPGELGPLATGP